MRVPGSPAVIRRELSERDTNKIRPNPMFIDPEVRRLGCIRTCLLRIGIDIQRRLVRGDYGDEVGTGDSRFHTKEPPHSPGGMFCCPTRIYHHFPSARVRSAESRMSKPPSRSLPV